MKLAILSCVFRSTLCLNVVMRPCTWRWEVTWGRWHVRRVTLASSCYTPGSTTTSICSYRITDTDEWRTLAGLVGVIMEPETQWDHSKGLSVNIFSRLVMEPESQWDRYKVCQSMLSPVEWSWSQWDRYKGLSVNVEFSRLAMEPMRPLQGSVRQCWV